MGQKKTGVLTAAFASLALLSALPLEKAQAAPGQVGMNFWFRSDWAEGGSNKVWKSGANFSTDSNPFNQAFLNELEPYSTLRFMDWVPTNNSPQTNWSDRRTKTDPVQTAEPNAAKGVAYEWMITLCNLKNAHMWITIPHKASDDYVWQLATLIKNNLNSNLNVYLEYSNETWNSGFSQSQYCIDQGRALGLHNIITGTGPNDNGRAAYAFYIYRSVRVWKTFNDVFGGSSRVKRVLAGMWNDGWQQGTWQAALNNSTVNPNNLRPTFVANAPYVGMGVNGSDSNALSQMYSDGDNVKQQAASFKTNVQNRFNCPAITYEGGQHVTNNASTLNYNSGMYDWQKDFLNDMAPSYNLIMLYAHSSTFDTYGAWGAKSYIGQPLSEAHKYRGIVDWINANGGNGKTTTPPPSSNLLSNPGFEAEQFNTQTPSGWNEWSGTGGVDSGYTEGGAQSGNYRAAHWKTSAYNMYTFQTKTGLANGLYKLTAYVRQGGQHNAVGMQAKNFGGTTLYYHLGGVSENNWTFVEINNINVTNGQCEIGFWSDSSGYGWLHFDNVVFTKQ